MIAIHSDLASWRGGCPFLFGPPPAMFIKGFFFLWPSIDTRILGSPERTLQASVILSVGKSNFYFGCFSPFFPSRQRLKLVSFWRFGRGWAKENFFIYLIFFACCYFCRMLFVLPRENPGSSERYYSSAKKEISIELERLLLPQVREREFGEGVCVFSSELKMRLLVIV